MRAVHVPYHINDTIGMQAVHDANDKFVRLSPGSRFIRARYLTYAKKTLWLDAPDCVRVHHQS